MKIFRPTYVKDFKCDGKACGSRCCRDWRVVLDEETREKFLRLPADDRQNIFKHVDESARAFKMKNSGACPFLDENFLCKLQLKHGEDFLTAVCQSFPRVTYKLGEGIFSQAMTLTCPVAAILILLREEPIDFEFVDELKARQVFDFTKRVSAAEKFLERQRAAIKILQRRELSLNRRLENLCEFFGEKISVPVDFDAENHAAALAEIFGETYEANLTVDKKKSARRNLLGEPKKYFESAARKFFRGAGKLSGERIFHAELSGCVHGRRGFQLPRVRDDLSGVGVRGGLDDHFQAANDFGRFFGIAVRTQRQTRPQQRRHGGDKNFCRAARR